MFLSQQRKKHFQSWQHSKKYCLNWYQFDIFNIISRHTAWLEDPEAVTPRASMKKVLLKISKYCLCRGLFFTKVAGWKRATLSNRHSGTGVFLWDLRSSKKELFYKHLGAAASEETISLADVSFHNASGLNYKQNR